MNETRLGDYSITFEQALFELTRIKAREFEAQDKPNIKSVHTWVLKDDGPRAYKAATFWTFRNAQTQEEHHHVLKIHTLRRQKTKNQWIVDEDYSIQLSDEDGDEIGELLRGLASVTEAGNQGDYLVIDLTNKTNDRVRQILEAIAISGRKVELLTEVLSWADDDPKITSALINLASDYPIRSKSLAAGLNYGRYRHALDEFKAAIEANHQEKFYQDFLEREFWMFGSEYSELLPNRTIVKGMILDFPLRRTVDGYLDIIEIKRPHTKTLFRKDNRGYLSETSDLVEAISQADNYLANIDAEQYQINYHEHLEVAKVRAKIIIGRDGNEEDLKALRRLNARTIRIEVITFDQLVKIAERILGILGDEAALNSIDQETSNIPIQPENFPDIPF